mmetsp:Transcript_51646/g.123051  ORF Transcript_51646/g.123051 Transcript_51646/m.123051 type:complete len:1017 (+) Transcript_51646:394-3444(+)
MGLICFYWLNAKHWREYLLDKGWSNRNATLFEHYWRLNIEQIAAVIPITLLLVTVMAVFFQRTVTSPAEIAAGMVFAIFGLSLFVDALRVVVMPLSEQLGTELPRTMPLPIVLAVTGALGVLVTYAEPAITSLRPLARLVDPQVAPYLYCALMQKQELLVLCIGLGVGVAAMLGTLRFVCDWSLKPLIVMILTPVLGLACYMWWGDNGELRPLLGLAFDCGAVTTGPVTVPVLLALGIGVMKTQKEKEKAKLQAESSVETGGEAVENAAADALEGFGIVTLASLLPVLSVELFSIGIRATNSHQDIFDNIETVEPGAEEEDGFLETTPWREIYFALRAILPLNIFLVLLVVVLLRKPLPIFTYYLAELPPMPEPKKSRDESRGRASFDNIRRSFGIARSGSNDNSISGGGAGLARISTEGSIMARGSAEFMRGIANRSKSFTIEVRRKLRNMKQALYTADSRSNQGSLAVWGTFMHGVTELTVARAEGVPVRFNNEMRGTTPSKLVHKSSSRVLIVPQAHAESNAGDIEMLEAAFTGELTKFGEKREVEGAGVMSREVARELEGIQEGVPMPQEEGEVGRSASVLRVTSSVDDGGIVPEEVAAIVAEEVAVLMTDGATPSERESSTASAAPSLSAAAEARSASVAASESGASGISQESAAGEQEGNGSQILKKGKKGDAPRDSGEQLKTKSISFHHTSKSHSLRPMGSDERNTADLLSNKSPTLRGASPGDEASANTEGVAVPPMDEFKEGDKKWSTTVLLCGIFQAQVGMIAFNLGLHFGFTSLGDQIGMLLPAAFMATDDEPSSPYYPYAAGVTIALMTMFFLGIFATRAEPALNVVGDTVQKLTKGSFSKNMLVYSVCFGVGVGMTVGSTKILFKAGLIWFILFKYAVALALTAFTKEDFINIAWDSAGVTTGPVTVPFVLSIGVGCSKAVKASEGFGILACASVWPIITVLSVDGLRRLRDSRRLTQDGHDEQVQSEDNSVRQSRDNFRHAPPSSRTEATRRSASFNTNGTL